MSIDSDHIMGHKETYIFEDNVGILSMSMLVSTGIK